MKNKYLILGSLLLALAVAIYLGCFYKKENTFYFENNYYGNNKQDIIELDELKKSISNKETFGLFVYQPMCSTSAAFEKVLNEFQNTYQVSFKKIEFSKIKDDDDFNFVKYYPSFLIYHDGKLVDFLESNKDEDKNYYKTSDGFKSWFTKYVRLKDVNHSSTNDEANNENNNINVSIKDINLDNVVRDKNKVNIYFFWGDGCPHCAAEKEFFKSINEEYGKYYNLYTFEVWNNKYNAELLKIFANSMNDELDGIPYTIIGDKSFNGFKNSSKEEFKKAIKSQYKKSYDVYFDKIKANNE